MLTRKSSLAARSKMLVFVPVALVCFFCFSKNVRSQKFEKNGNTVTYNGNVFEMSEPHEDTAFVIDPVTGQERMLITETVPWPVKMNGEKIYNTDEVTSLPEFRPNNKKLFPYLRAGIEKELSKLPDGSFYLDLQNVVVGTDGTIIFYDYKGVSTAGTMYDRNIPIPEVTKKEIETKVVKMLKEARNIKPGMYNGKKVLALVTGISFMDAFEIKDHKIN